MVDTYNIGFFYKFYKGYRKIYFHNICYKNRQLKLKCPIYVFKCPLCASWDTTEAPSRYARETNADILAQLNLRPCHHRVSGC